MAETLGKFADEMWHRRDEDTDPFEFRRLERTLLDFMGTVPHLDSPLPDAVGMRIRAEFANLLCDTAEAGTPAFLHGFRNENGKWIVQ